MNVLYSKGLLLFNLIKSNMTYVLLLLATVAVVIGVVVVFVGGAKSTAKSIWSKWSSNFYENKLKELTKKKSIMEEFDIKHEEILAKLDKDIALVHKTSQKKKLESLGLNDEEVAKQLTDMGF